MTNLYRFSGNAVHLTVRGELVEPPASQPEPFDKLRANGIFSKVNSIGFSGLLAALLLSANVCAGDIQIDEAHAYASASGRNSANVYFFITSKQATTLMGASSPASQTVAMRTMAHKGSMMKTLDVPSIDLPAGKRMDMTSAHGYHLTLVDLKAPLKAGETVPLTLNIEMAGKQSVKVDMRAEIKPPK